MDSVDVIIVGSGPNGMSAAVTMARAGLSVRVYERNPTIGGGARTLELVESGSVNDICSAVHPMALASGFFRRFQLNRRIDLRLPEISYGHPLDGGRAGIAWKDIDRTADGLGVDGPAWKQLMGPLADRAHEVAQFAGSNIVRWPDHPGTIVRLGLRILEQGGPLWNLRFREEEAPALLSGAFAHAIMTMPSLSTAAAGLVLATHAHARGWPIPVGGSQSIIDAMRDDLEAHGGEIVTGVDVTSVDDLPPARAVIFDTSARALVRIAGSRLPTSYGRRLARFHYGNAIAKADFVLNAPVPWRNADLHGAGTVHVAGTRAELARSEADVAAGRHPSSPYVLLSQPSTFDATRAPAGKHVLWTYTHVPARSSVDRTDAIVAQIERFAPGFRDTIVASSSETAEQVELHNPNYDGAPEAMSPPT